MTTSRYRDEKGRLIIGTSIVKQFSADNPCPAKLEAVYMNGLGREDPTEAMIKGNYFETLVLGCCSDGTRVDDLPRKKTKVKGTDEFAKYIDQVRIDLQAVLFPKVMKHHKIEIDEVQTRMINEIDDTLVIGTAADAIGTIDKSLLVLDVKLTKDITSTWGDFCWGSPEHMDHSQAVLLSWLYEKCYSVKPRFIYAVFDYKEHSDHELIEKVVTATDYIELQNKIRLVLEKINHFQESGWYKVASYANCRNCPLKQECVKTVKIKPIKTI